MKAMAINWNTYKPVPYDKSPYSSDRFVETSKGRVDFEFIGSQFDPVLRNYAESVDPPGFQQRVLDTATALIEHIEGQNPPGMFPRNVGQSGRRRMYDMLVNVQRLVLDASNADYRGSDGNPATLDVRIFMMQQAVEQLWKVYVLLAAYALEDRDYVPPFQVDVQRKPSKAKAPTGKTQGAKGSAPTTTAPSGSGGGTMTFIPSIPGLGEEAPSDDTAPEDDMTDDDPEGTAPASSSSSLPLIVGGAAALLLLVAMSRKGR